MTQINSKTRHIWIALFWRNSHTATMSEGKSRRYRKRRRQDSRKTKRRILFYAGVKSDGAPRGWTLQELLFTFLCAVFVMLASFWLLQWLMNLEFGFGK